MTPKNKTENLIAVAGSACLSLIVVFLGSYIKQATSIPEDAPINVRLLMIDLAIFMTGLIPAIGIALGLPRLGKEHLASIISEIGPAEAQARLETPMEITDLRTIDMEALAKAVLDERDKRLKNAQQQPNGDLLTSRN